MTEREFMQRVGKGIIPTYAPAPTTRRQNARYGQTVTARDRWQRKAWQDATGRDEPQPAPYPLMDPAEVGRVMIALNRKTMPGLKVTL